MFNDSLYGFQVQSNYITDSVLTVWEFLGSDQPISAYQELIGQMFIENGLLVEADRWFTAHTASGVPYRFCVPFVIADEILVFIVPDTRIKKCYYRQAHMFMRASYMNYSMLVNVGGKRLQVRSVVL